MPEILNKSVKGVSKALTGKYKPFDPRIKYESEADKAAARQIWSTKSIDLAQEALGEGLNIKADPFFKGNSLLKKPHLLFRRTHDEEREWIRCKFDIIHFAEQYCQLLTGSGDYEPIELREYQKKLLVAMATKDKVICLGSRQLGKTTTTAIFILWMCIFHKNISVALLGDKLATSIENLNKIKEILYRLPVWLKPGIVSWNVRSIAFDNRSKVFTGPCNKGALVGKTVNILFIDEFAIPTPKQAEEVANFAFPVVETMIASGKGKIIVVSTPNGDGPFKDYWHNAVYGKNGFYAIKVPWYLVPGRDLKWRADKIASIGIDNFNEQYNCTFLSSNNCIFNDLTIRKLTSEKKRFVPVEFEDHSLNNVLHRVIRRAPSTMTEPINNLRVMKGYDIENFKKHPHLITIDIAEGILQDYTSFNIFRPIFRKDMYDNSNRLKEDNLKGKSDPDDELAWMADETDFAALANSENCAEFIDFEQVAIFHSNDHCIRTSSLFLRILFTKYFNPDESKIVIELNKYGGQFLDLLLNHQLYPEYEIEQDSIGYYQIGEGKLTQGILYNGANKKLMVPQCKTDIETGRIKLFDELSINECTTFGQNPNGTYSASQGAHDDIMMTNVTCSAWAQPENNGFVIWVEEVLAVDPSQRGLDDDEDDAMLYDQL